jgi:anti-anti-sigma factor
MSILPRARHASHEFVIERSECRTAQFANRWLRPALSVVTVHGELDAANAKEFVDYALRYAPDMDGLVIDMSGVDFFGTAGFSALHTLNVRCAGDRIPWALTPSPAVTRLLRICDPDSALPICATVDVALSTVQCEPPPLLQLVAKSR